MSYNLLWMFLLPTFLDAVCRAECARCVTILQTLVAPFPVPNPYDMGVIGIDQQSMSNSPKLPNYGDSPGSSDEKVISVRITSSVAVGRGRAKLTHRRPDELMDYDLKDGASRVPASIQSTTLHNNVEFALTGATDVPPNLVGANIEYLKQINAKKESREHSLDPVHPFQLSVKDQQDELNESPQRESLTKTDDYENIQDVPLARKVPSTADANHFQSQKPIQRLEDTDMKLPVEGYGQNNITHEPLFKSPSVQFGLTSNSNDNKNIRNLTTLPNVDQINQSDKKGTRDIDRLTHIGTFVSNSNNHQSDDSVAESSIKSVEFAKFNERIDNIALTAPMRSPNKIQGLTNRALNEGRNNARLTTVSFNIVHDTPKTDSEPANSFISSSQIHSNQKQLYDTPKVYSQPAQIYSEPAKFYSEPAKIYSEPAKIYSEPAKVYSEPAKIYSEPSKFYSEPASLHLEQNVPSSIAPNYSPWQGQPLRPIGSTTMNTTPLSTVTNAFPRDSFNEHQPEKNYEVDEKISVLTDGRSHGVQQETSTEKCKQDNCKVGYVVEGRQFKKYRVEERTPDGFIVGEYGVVRNEDGALRGVRYTADSDVNPRLIHDGLMKFLQLT